MSDETHRNGIPPDILADAQAILDSFSKGKPADADAARRLRAYSQMITEQTRQKFGEIDVDALLHAARDE